MQVSLPADYIGKEVHVLFYVDEEVKQTTASISPSKDRSEFLSAINSKKVEHDTHLSIRFDEKVAQLRKAATDPLFLSDIQEVEDDFKIADQENV